MTKIYRAGTGIAIKVMLQNGASRYVSFSQHSDGSSTFTTKDEELQKALERHYRFGELFRLEAEVDETQPVKVKVEQKPVEEAKLVVKVSDVASAKDYLANHFGEVRTSMRTTKAVLEAAAKHNIEFEGL